MFNGANSFHQNLTMWGDEPPLSTNFCPTPAICDSTAAVMVRTQFYIFVHISSLTFICTS